MDTQQPGSPATSAPPASTATEGGLAALFDLSFTRFITTSFLRVIYALVLLAIAIVWLGAVITGFASGGVAGGLAALVVGSVIAVVYAIFARVGLEVIVIVFRIADNTAKLVEQGRARGQ